MKETMRPTTNNHTAGAGETDGRQISGTVKQRLRLNSVQVGQDKIDRMVKQESRIISMVYIGTATYLYKHCSFPAIQSGSCRFISG